jgi:hypothetical protein
MNVNLLSTGSPLVLKAFHVDAASGRVQIVGRKPGLLAFLLNMMGFDATSWLEASRHEVRFRRASLFGEELSVCPCPNIASTSCGYLKPVQLLILAFLLLVASIYTTAIGEGTAAGILALIAIGALVLYFLKKKLYVLIQPSGGPPFLIVFKRSVIENVRVDMDQAREAISVISQNIVSTQTYGIPPTLTPPPAPHLGRLGAAGAPATPPGFDDPSGRGA